MCFSPTASFVTAGLTATLGALALRRTASARELPLAAMPLIFGLQQGIEGLLWLSVRNSLDSPLTAGLSMAFLTIAQVLWPVYAPIAVLIVEREKPRREVIIACAVLGASVSAYLLAGLLTHPNIGVLIDEHLVYGSALTRSASIMIGLMYLAATTLPLLVSSKRTVVAVGVVVLIGSLVAYGFYQHAFQSVWCYFAATASAMLVFHFYRVRWAETQLGPALRSV
jgi:hypothetical protein